MRTLLGGAYVLFRAISYEWTGWLLLRQRIDHWHDIEASDPKHGQHVVVAQVNSLDYIHLSLVQVHENILLLRKGVIRIKRLAQPCYLLAIRVI